jgi:hypothetical protein
MAKLKFSGTTGCRTPGLWSEIFQQEHEQTVTPGLAELRWKAMRQAVHCIAAQVAANTISANDDDLPPTISWLPTRLAQGGETPSMKKGAGQRAFNIPPAGSHRCVLRRGIAEPRPRRTCGLPRSRRGGHGAAQEAAFTGRRNENRGVRKGGYRTPWGPLAGSQTQTPTPVSRRYRRGAIAAPRTIGSRDPADHAGNA